jgi:hypothetical protein
MLYRAVAARYFDGKPTIATLNANYLARRSG